MAGRYRGNRQIPQEQRASFGQRAGRWLARRGYDLANMLVPGTLFDYREHRTIDPRTAFRDSTVSEITRWARGRPEGMSDEEWARVQREGKEGVFDTAWSLLPIPKIPYLTSAAGRAVRNQVMGPRSRSARQAPVTATVIPTVSGAGVTTTEKPVTITGKPTSLANSAGQGGGFPSNQNALSGRGYGSTIGRGVGVADDPSDILDMLDFSGGFGGVGYRGVTGGLSEINPMALESQDIYNTVTGQQMLPRFNNGAYDAEHMATQGPRMKY